MKVKELKKILSGLDPEHEIILSASKNDGRAYTSIHHSDTGYVTEIRPGILDFNQDFKTEQPALCLYPTWDN